MDSRRICLNQVYKLPKTHLLFIVKILVGLLVFCLLFVQIVYKLVVKQIVCPPVRPIILENRQTINLQILFIFCKTFVD